MPGTAARTFACAADLFARVRKLRYEGIAIASRIPRMMLTTRSSIRVKPRSSATRCRKLIMFRCSFGLVGTYGGSTIHRHTKPLPLTRTGEKKRARFPAPFSDRDGVLLAAAGLDVARRARLVVRRGARRGVPDAVAARRGNRDLDVLDAGVVRLLELRERHADVARRMVGVVRLHARNRGADVRLRSGLVRPRAEAQIRGNRDRKQDSQNDDHDQKLDQRETFLTPRLADPVLKPCEH